MKYLIVLSLLLSAQAFAAIPKNEGPQKPITVTSPEGFALLGLETEWFQAPPPPNKKGIHMLFRSPDNKKNFQALLTVRIDRDASKTKNIRQYVKNWIGDYPKLGYKLLGHKVFTHRGNPSYVIDVRNEKTKRQVRQTVFYRNDKAVIMTCIDSVDSFRDSLKECNKVIRSFSWNKTN